MEKGNQDQHAMNDKLEAKIRQRANEIGEGESHPTAEQHWLEAEHEVTEEAENAAISRWAAPVSGTYVEKSNEAAKNAEKTREAVSAARSGATSAAGTPSAHASALAGSRDLAES
jgi:hypothetical protein